MESSWDEAMDLVVGRTKELLEEQGPSAVAFYTTGQLFLEEYYTLPTRHPLRRPCREAGGRVPVAVA
ncbi:hypothetical protein [Georgenia sp. SUBG003]|uniref:hypothetical protein n=1 Tax=Georgenia sp. SUBG003 TaxID=1497974 RepID=UPI003AB1A86B